MNRKQFCLKTLKCASQRVLVNIISFSEQDLSQNETSKLANQIMTQQ